ncbi:DnaB-like helicase N terminal domain-containing protein [Lachnospiraceae bacterium]|nr:DnaB-like helicase N terminal domain-containing protein [Lachnospiraceae bacterium]
MDNETLINRVPPHSVEAEQSVIGAMFLGKEAIIAASEMLVPDDFFARQYVVMFIYRDDYYHSDTDEKNIAEVIIAKQRNGSIGTIKLAWLPQYTKFANPDFSSSGGK